MLMKHTDLSKFGMVDGVKVFRPSPKDKRRVSILELLYWAFVWERAQLDFDEMHFTAGGGGSSHNLIYRMMQDAKLGCRPDGGGSSDPHPDADVVASAVSALAVPFGGFQMSIKIAELARAGEVHGYLTARDQRCVPVETTTNRHGTRGKKRDSLELGANGWAWQPEEKRNGEIILKVVPYTPVRYTPSASAIAASQRAYQDWWRALRDLRESFRIYGGLSCFTVSMDMPPRTPW